MDPNQQNQAPGRRLHIAHRRSPSELTPLMAEQLALQHQIEMLQAQQQQILNTHQQYMNMGIIPAGQSHLGQVAFNPLQQQIPHLSPQPQHGFQFPQQQQQQQQQQSAPLGAPTQPSSHRRQPSGMGGMGGPPPAPSSGSSSNLGGDNSGPQRRPSGGQNPAQGHTRRHSLALADAKKAAEQAQARRTQAGFQFPIPTPGGPNVASTTTPPATSSTPPAAAAPAATATASTSETTNPSGGASNTAGGLGQRSRLSGHGRSQSMAVGSGRGAPATGRIGGFQFPAPAANADQSTLQPTGQQSSGQNVERRSSGHQRSGSRNYEGNWRNQNQNQNNAPEPQPQAQSQPQQQQFNQGFQPGHRQRASMSATIGSFSFPGQTGLLIPGAPSQGIFVNPATGQPQLINTGLLTQQQQLTQLQLQQAAQAINAQQMGLGQMSVPQSGNQQLSNQQQRKTLFTPYLPQASLPALLSNGQLVSGILRVNKKNRSDAYVSTQDGLLDADIFICGSKDRNRALEGDLVAVELLDVDEVWGQKREKEEKKKRKDNTGPGGNSSSGAGAGGSESQEQSQEGGGMRRRGSLRQRPTQKKNDDVEVEGQSLLLVEEEEINDEQKPLYAGHIVAVIERVAGQMFSGTLGLLRPSSQATKEKQEAERQAREGPSGRQHQPERQQEKPKIVWFKPTDKRVPLIAIPTEQAPRDFVENHQSYANRIFVACIKRWPITSLHPFGTLVEQLGEMGDTKIETDALLRDNNFGPDEFVEAVIKSVGFDTWSVETEEESVVQGRKDFTQEQIFTIAPASQGLSDSAYHVKPLRDGVIEIGVHVADVAHFVKPNSLVDREAKKRGTGVNLINRSVPLLPPKLADDLLALKKNEARFTVSVVFAIDKQSGKIIEEETWVGKSIVKSVSEVTHASINKAISKSEGVELEAEFTEAIETLYDVAQKLRRQRLSITGTNNTTLRLLHQLDDEAIPVEENIFHSTPAQGLIEELSITTNAFIAQKIAAALPDKALLRRHAPAIQRRIDIFGNRMNRLGHSIDITNGATIQNSLLNLESDIIRKGMQTLLIKAMQRGKYFVAGKLPEQMYKHYINNLPIYTHFTNPSRRYADIIVHRQLETALSNGAVEFTEDADSLSKTAEQCNVKKDSAKNAQEQSIHLQLCRAVDQRRAALNGELICEAIVINVYESAFDVLIPEYGFEKRVHCDQLPLKKAEFDKNNRVLELYWEKGVQSSVYIPEDERPKGVAALRAANAAAAAATAAAAAKAAQDQEEAQRRAMDIASLSINDVDALFDDDDEGADITEQQASLAPPSSNNRPTQSMPPSPTRGSSAQAPHRTRSDPKLAVTAADNEVHVEPSLKEKYGHMFTLREEKGDYIQEVREMTMVPVFLKTELSKSPPCLTIRSLNPYAF
ncbi:hypothetical protein DFH27DRAFT_40483 [Peziza echinospora]|nr:hypothetical protein DFH27DRAFT_40483 [Peziza echinospora]